MGYTYGISLLNAGSLRKCRGGVANLYDGIQFIPVNYSAFSLDFLSFRELARIVPAAVATPRPPASRFYAYDFIHVKYYINRGLFSQRIYNYRHCDIFRSFRAFAFFSICFVAITNL